MMILMCFQIISLINLIPDHLTDMFSFLLKQCESDPLCRKLSLQGIISSSYQRLTKYPLFIEGLIKATPGKPSTQYHALKQYGLT